MDDTLIDTSYSITRHLWKQALDAMIQQGLLVKDPSKALFHLWALDQNTQGAAETLRLFLSFYQADLSLQAAGLKALQDLSQAEVKVVPLPGVLSGLEKLKNFSLLAIVSRGEEALQLLKLEKAGIDTRFFSKIYISKQEDKKIYYQRLLEELGKIPQESYVVGDRVLIDLKPAKELRFHTVHMKWGRGKIYSPWSQYVDKEIYQFSELVSYFEQCVTGVVKDGKY